MNRVAIIGSGILSKELAERSKTISVETYCFSNNENDVACNSVDHFFNIDIFDIDKIVNICRENKVEGVIATTELTILPAAKIAEKLGYLCNPVSVAKDITNKYLTRNKLNNIADLNQPQYLLYTGGEKPKLNSFPVVVKPIAAGGKRGVNVCYSQCEVEKSIDEALPYSRVQGVLIEEFLNGGKEYSVETLSYKGRHYVTQITEKDTSGAPHCNELGHHQPAEISNQMRIKVDDVISNMLTAIGITNGPSHTEIKIIDEKIYLIEINDRPGGDHITYPLTELSTGYPYLSGIIWAALGMLEGREPINLNSYYTGIYFITDKTQQYEDIFEECD